MSTTSSPAHRPARLVPLLAFAAASTLAAGAAGAQRTSAPAASAATALLDRPARLRVRDVSLADALGELERRSGVPLAYSPSLLPRDRSLRCTCDDATIAQALRQLLAAVPFTFREADGQVMVVPAPAVPAPRDASGESPGALGIVMPSTLLAAAADSATVTGKVTTDAGTPIAAAIVTIPSLRLSATTNDAGVYRITVPPAAFVARTDTLRVTRLGYRPVTVRFTLAPGRVTGVTSN